MYHEVSATSPALLVAALNAAGAPATGVSFVCNERGYVAFWHA